MRARRGGAWRTLAPWLLASLALVGCHGRARTGAAARAQPRTGPALATFDFSAGLPEAPPENMLGLASRKHTFDEALRAIEHVREGKGPIFIECKTLRVQEHSVGGVVEDGGLGHVAHALHVGDAGQARDQRRQQPLRAADRGGLHEQRHERDGARQVGHPHHERPQCRREAHQERTSQQGGEKHGVRSRRRRPAAFTVLRLDGNVSVRDRRRRGVGGASSAG